MENDANLPKTRLGGNRDTATVQRIRILTIPIHQFVCEVESTMNRLAGGILLCVCAGLVSHCDQDEITSSKVTELLIGERTPMYCRTGLVSERGLIVKSRAERGGQCLKELQKAGLASIDRVRFGDSDHQGPIANQLVRQELTVKPWRCHAVY